MPYTDGQGYRRATVRGATPTMSHFRDPRRRVALICVLVLLLGAWAASGVHVPEERLTVRASTAGPIPVLRDDDRVWNIVRFEPGGLVELHLPLAQRGPLPVTVADARVTRRAMAEGCGWAIDEVELRRGGGRAALGRGGERAALERGEVAELRLAGRFSGEPGCLPSSMPVSRGAAYVDISVAGVPRQQRIPLPEVLTWSTDPDASADRFARSPTAPRVGSPA